MPRDLSRLLRPRSIAVVGGGVWCRQIIHQSVAMGFTGDIFRVHPKPDPVEGVRAVPRIADLPYPPDAVFLGVNRHATLEAVKALAALGAGGAVCFASGFSEAVAEDAASADLQAQLVDAAADMPVLGPNCYGFINAVDGALLWPDQQGCKRVDRGVAILTQSSNIAINLTMQKRALPISYMVTCGNMAQTTQAEIALSLLDDPRVTALGLHIEGFGDTDLWHVVALKAQTKGVALVVLKVGVSDQAQHATVSHTASLAGSDAGAWALLRHLGIPRVDDLPTLLSTLMLLHCNGPLSSNALSSISCSGGEASLIADVAQGFEVQFPALHDTQRRALTQALGPMVALSNPLDYHTYVWGDVAKMTAAWQPMAAQHIGLVLIILDYPHTDASAWDCATQAAIALRQISNKPVAVVSSLPELLPEEFATRLLAAGVTPLHGMREAIAAAQAASQLRAPAVAAPLKVGTEGFPQIMREAEAKAALAVFGVPVPKSKGAARMDLPAAITGLTEPLALKAQGFAHKTEAGALFLNLTANQVVAHVKHMPGDHFLVEEMVPDGVAELLIGVTRDAAHGFILTLGAGGVLTELWQDSVCVLLPVARENVATCLKTLRIYPLLTRYRGQPAADINAVLDVVMAVQNYVITEAASVHEVEINPLICTPHSAVAADALIAKLTNPTHAGETDGPD